MFWAAPRNQTALNININEPSNPLNKNMAGVFLAHPTLKHACSSTLLPTHFQKPDFASAYVASIDQIRGWVLAKDSMTNIISSRESATEASSYLYFVADSVRLRYDVE